MHHSTPARARRPSDAMRVKALRSRMRQIKRTDGADPWHGGPSTLPGRRGCSCGYGSRASWHDVGCSVGRCASRNPSSSHIQWRFSRSLSIANEAPHRLAKSSHEATRLRVIAADSPLRPAVFGVAPHLLACALLASTRLVHIVWTSVWTKPDQREGDAGERP